MQERAPKKLNIFFFHPAGQELTALSRDAIFWASMESPNVAVVIVSFNTKQLLFECLESVRSSPGPASTDMVVVDNASDDGSPDMVRRYYPEAQLICNSTNLGFARASNQGIRSTSAPFLLLLNSDARLSRSTIEALLSCLLSSDSCAAAGCLVFDQAGRDQPTTWHFLTPFNQALELVGLNRFPLRGFSRRYKPQPDPNGLDCSVDWIEASCLLLRRAALDRVGTFDERFFMYSEDEDLCWRLRRSGWLICHSNRGHAVHSGGASSKHDPFLNLCHFYRSQYLLLMKQRGPISAQLYLMANEIALLLKRVFHHLQGNHDRLGEARLRWKAIRRASRSADQDNQPAPRQGSGNPSGSGGLD